MRKVGHFKVAKSPRHGIDLTGLSEADLEQLGKGLAADIKREKEEINQAYAEQLDQFSLAGNLAKCEVFPTPSEDNPLEPTSAPSTEPPVTLPLQAQLRQALSQLADAIAEGNELGIKGGMPKGVEDWPLVSLQAKTAAIRQQIQDKRGVI